MVVSAEVETIYERVSKLEDEIAILQEEIDVLKHILKNKIKRYEITKIKDEDDDDSVNSARD